MKYCDHCDAPNKNSVSKCVRCSADFDSPTRTQPYLPPKKMSAAGIFLIMLIGLLAVSAALFVYAKLLQAKIESGNYYVTVEQDYGAFVQTGGDDFASSNTNTAEIRTLTGTWYDPSGLPAFNVTKTYDGSPSVTDPASFDRLFGGDDDSLWEMSFSDTNDIGDNYTFNLTLENDSKKMTCRGVYNDKLMAIMLEDGRTSVLTAPSGKFVFYYESGFVGEWKLDGETVLALNSDGKGEFMSNDGSHIKLEEWSVIKDYLVCTAEDGTSRIFYIDSYHGEVGLSVSYFSFTGKDIIAEWCSLTLTKE